MEIAFGLDDDSDAGKTFEANFPEVAFLERDIPRFPKEDLAPYVEADRDHVLFSVQLCLVRRSQKFCCAGCLNDFLLPYAL